MADSRGHSGDPGGGRGGGRLERNVDLLHLERWPASDSRARLIIVHGVGEHIGRYAGLGRFLAGRGIECLGQDQRGHGRSRGQRGHVRRFADYVDDLAGLVASEAMRPPRRPIFLLGHSMGSIVALLYAERRTGVLAGLVVTGTALEPAAVPPRWLGRLVHRLSRLLPRLPLPNRISADDLSQDGAVRRQYLRDPLVASSVSARWASEFDHARQRALAAAAGLELPLLVIHGGDDRIARPRGSRALAERAASADKRLVVLAGQRHEVLNEPPELRRATWQMIADWVLDHA